MCEGWFPVQKYSFLWFQQIQAYVLWAVKILIKCKTIHSNTQVHFINRTQKLLIFIWTVKENREGIKNTILASSMRTTSDPIWHIFGALLYTVHLKYNVNIEQ